MKITAILSALAAATLVSAGKFHTTQPGKANVVPGAYIIEYKDGVSRSNAHDNLKKHAVDYKVRNEYDVFNGAAITVKSEHDGKALAAVPGVKNKYKLTGKGVKVGIIDTGIDYKHPAFAAPGATEGCFARYGKNCRVKYGWDFVGDDYDG
ncbi:hypothetical protein BGX30_001511, partial [Mortierella sp. GBA39]